jgi:integrase
MSKPLTAAAVEKYRPLGKQRRIIRDTGARSLFLTIAPSGAKSWTMRFRTHGGRIGKITLGPVDLSGRELSGDPQIGQPLTLAAARQLAAEVLRQRALGHDPVADHKARKLRQRAAVIEEATNTFDSAAKEFVEYASKKIRRWKEEARLLGLRPAAHGLEVIPGGLAQRWNHKPIGKIDGHDIHGIVAETRERGAPGLERRSDGPTESRARAMLATLSSMFSWLHKHRRVEANPCVGVHRPEAAKARERVLSNVEIRWLWQACGAREGLGEPFAAIVKLLLLTGQRLNEVAGMRRDELSEDDATWIIPSARSKNRQASSWPRVEGRKSDLPSVEKA